MALKNMFTLALNACFQIRILLILEYGNEKRRRISTALFIKILGFAIL